MFRVRVLNHRCSVLIALRIVGLFHLIHFLTASVILIDYVVANIINKLQALFIMNDSTNLICVYVICYSRLYPLTYVHIFRISAHIYLSVLCYDTFCVWGIL